MLTMFTSSGAVGELHIESKSEIEMSPYIKKIYCVIILLIIVLDNFTLCEMLFENLVHIISILLAIFQIRVASNFICNM